MTRDTTPAGEGAERIYAANGSRLHERMIGGKWAVVGPGDDQGRLPTGLYRLDTAKVIAPADKGEYPGLILHVDSKHVYQLHGDGVARHSRFAFKQAPNVGELARIEYHYGKATLANRPPEQQRGRSI